VDRQLSELAKIPLATDLIISPEEEVEPALKALEALVRKIAAEKWLTDMAASKVLHFLRPHFVAISDSYVRQSLGISDDPWHFLPREEAYAARMVAVQRGMRELGQQNQAVLEDLLSYVQTLPPIVGRGPCAGEQVDVKLSRLRILDILLWANVAIHGSNPHSRWRRWYLDEVAKKT